MREEKIKDLLDGLCLSLEDTSTLGFACRTAMKANNSTSHVVALIHAQQRLIDLIKELGYDVPRVKDLTGLYPKGVKP